MRRSKFAGLLAMITAVGSFAVGQPQVLADTATGVVAIGGSTGRAVDFGGAWKFALANRNGITDPDGRFAHAQEPGYDDSSWRRVRVPHDWSIELDPTTEGGTNSGTGFLPGGLGWYRKTFTLPRSMAGKRIAIEFDGVYMDSHVYANGRLVASHPYGYTGFAADVTSLLHTDGQTGNVIAVKVQNQLRRRARYGRPARGVIVVWQRIKDSPSEPAVED